MFQVQQGLICVTSQFFLFCQIFFHALFPVEVIAEVGEVVHLPFATFVDKVYPSFNENRHEIYVKGMKRVKNSPLFIDDTHSLSVLELASKVRQLVGKQWIRLVIVDYLQLMKRGGSSCFDEEPTKIVHSMRELAMELNITFIVCAQLPPRARGERKRPGLSTIKRYLGNIEKETDMIVCLHRPEYYRIMRKDDEEVHGIAEIIVVKNAFSEKHNFHLIYRPRFCRFYDKKTVDDSLTRKQHLGLKIEEGIPES